MAQLFFGHVPDRAARYTELLKAAYPAIKASQPDSTVIAAGLSRAWAPDDPPTFVKAMYQLGAKGSFDAMAMHPYVYPNGLAVDDHNGWSDVERVHRLMVDNGDGAKKIWMTEIGAPTSAPSAAGVSQDEPSDIGRCYPGLRSRFGGAEQSRVGRRLRVQQCSPCDLL